MDLTTSPTAAANDGCSGCQPRSARIALAFTRNDVTSEATSGLRKVATES
jgi:hypothetical protein